MWIVRVYVLWWQTICWRIVPSPIFQHDSQRAGSTVGTLHRAHETRNCDTNTIQQIHNPLLLSVSNGHKHATQAISSVLFSSSVLISFGCIPGICTFTRANKIFEFVNLFQVERLLSWTANRWLMNSIRSGNAAVQKCENKRPWGEIVTCALSCTQIKTWHSTHKINSRSGREVCGSKCAIRWLESSRTFSLFNCYKQVSRLRIARNKHSAEYRICIELGI